ncbi:hypothetical protein CO151_00555 [bacterium CG_4_9_14_3_um_filter_65_15]|nr:MAG: hypothetical protein CO151_00555 [bacterium CG_4_9_14_3_um_filter_65_15]
MSTEPCRSPGNSKKGPIFVVGAPRTGTTLTMEILNNHSLVHLYNEVHYNERIADLIPCEEPLDPENLQKSAETLLAKSPWKHGGNDPASDLADLVTKARKLGGTHGAVLEAFLGAESAASGKIIWGDSSPQDVLYLDRLKDWYPDARFVGVVRDPRAYLASYKNYYRKQLKSYRNRFNPLANCLLWRSYMRALLAAKSGLFGASVHLLHYEDLVSHPEIEIRKLSEFLDLPYEETMHAVGRQNSSYIPVAEDSKNTGINAGSRDRWNTELTGAEIWLTQKIAGRELIELGYSPVPVTFRREEFWSDIRTLNAMPGRVFNLLFRTGKPFTLAKLKRVLGKSR